MSRGKIKLTPEERSAFVERYLRKEVGIKSLAKEAQVAASTIKEWVIFYENEVPIGLLPTKKNKSYLAELKLNAVHDYLARWWFGSYMSKPRKTTLNERIDIVHECIINRRDYGKTAIQYQISYQQVRNWMFKYELCMSCQ